MMLIPKLQVMNLYPILTYIIEIMKELEIWEVQLIEEMNLYQALN